MALKNVGTNREIRRAKFVVRGHTAYGKNLLVHTVTNVRQRRIKMLIATAAIFGLRLWTQDIMQANLQSTSKITRDIYVKPKNGFHLKINELRKLLKPLYGLSDSGDYCHMTMKNNLMNDLTMHSLTGDLALFMNCVQRILSGMIGTYVDDMIAASDLEFQEQSKATERRSKAKDREFHSFTFAGINIKKESKNYILNRESYAKNIQLLSPDCIFKHSGEDDKSWHGSHTRDRIYALPSDFFLNIGREFRQISNKIGK